MVRFGQRSFILYIFIGLLGAALLSSSSQAGKGVSLKHEADASGISVFLPIAQKSENFSQVEAIWVNSDDPGRHQVAFFRKKINCTDGCPSVRLQMFADTRYEVWLDGIWLGRGPARFSTVLHEYDSYQLGDLSPGEHLLAVLVQWSPNYRRSESTRPYLQARLSSKSEFGTVILAESGQEWKTSLGSAWNEQAVPVHRWDLIGSTELVDFRKLPANWQNQSFDDTGWEQAQVVSKERITSQNIVTLVDVASGESTYLYGFNPKREASTPAIQPEYRERTIEMLVENLVSYSILESGQLSPGWDIREIVGQPGLPHTIPISATSAVSLTLQTIQVGDELANTLFLLNGHNLIWEEAQAGVPDIYQSLVNLVPGENNLTIVNMPEEGITLGASAGAANFSELSIEQGVHVGRRLLLAEPVETPEAVLVQKTDSITLTFQQLPAYVLIDLGRVVHGRVEFTATGLAGSIIDVGWDERLTPDTGRALPFPGSWHQEWNQVDSFILDGSEWRVSTIDARAGRYILIAVWGSGIVRLENLVVKEEVYPVIGFGSFDSGDPQLDQIWQIGVDTLRTNMTDAYTDTPWRERGQWWGDAFIEHRINLAVFGDEKLYERGVLLMANGGPNGEIYGIAPNGAGLPMLDYGMLWVQSLYDLAVTGGNTELLYRTYTSLVEFMNYVGGFESPESGLLDLPDEHWSQTAYVDTIGYRDRHGQSTAINALYADTLSKAASLAGLLNDSLRAQAWMVRRSQVLQQINDLLYLPQQGRYAAALYDGNLTLPTVHAQSWALSYGIVPDDQKNAVLNSLIELIGSNPNSSVTGTYGFAWILQALGENGRIDEALELIRVFYGYMVSNGATTWWEWLESDQHYSNSLSHGWSGSPTWFLSSYVLGGKRTGVDTWEVRIPAMSSLQRVSGKFPLDDELVEVSWSRKSCKQLYVRLVSPEGSLGKLVLPEGTAVARFWRNGLELELAGRAAGEYPYMSVPGAAGLLGGEFEMELTMDCGIGS